MCWRGSDWGTQRSMACLNDVLVSMTLNELVIGHGELPAMFFYGHFTAHHKMGSPWMSDLCVPMASRGPGITKPWAFQAELGLQPHVCWSRCLHPCRIRHWPLTPKSTLVLISEGSSDLGHVQNRNTYKIEKAKSFFLLGFGEGWPKILCLYYGWDNQAHGSVYLRATQLDWMI